MKDLFSILRYAILSLIELISILSIKYISIHFFYYYKTPCFSVPEHLSCCNVYFISFDFIYCIMYISWLKHYYDIPCGNWFYLFVWLCDSFFYITSSHLCYALSCLPLFLLPFSLSCILFIYPPQSLAFQSCFLLPLFYFFLVCWFAFCFLFDHQSIYLMVTALSLYSFGCNWSSPLRISLAFLVLRRLLSKFRYLLSYCILNKSYIR